MNVDELAALLAETGEAHHQAFIETDGEDPEWAAWYTAYLQDRLGVFFGRNLSQEEIAEVLTELDERYSAHQVNADWSTYYAQALMKLWG